MKPLTAKRRNSARSVLIQFVAVLLGHLIMFPIIFCICSAFKSENQILNGSGQLFPREIT